ncbi:MAG TPA: 5-formyltetrahydrofolate cyclo-ligase [Pseudonocardiaceae bacterium]|nr:5-formyltetrahydrofolate cyclo-ligase [Pseudonocardiaceae bacterium]
MADPGEDRYSKRDWRARLLAARESVPPEQRADEAHSLATAAVDIPAGLVCCYVPVGGEPGSLELITALADAGRRVLLPVVVGATPLDWAYYDGPESLAPGPYDLLQPSGPRLGAAAIGQADLVLVPALAVDLAGHRIGRGGGHYDRSLPLATPGTPLVAVVRDDEVVDELPSEPHDVPMTAALTPIGGLLRLG